jgi:hypothetical protein
VYQDGISSSQKKKKDGISPSRRQFLSVLSGGRVDLEVKQRRRLGRWISHYIQLRGM